MQEEFSLGSCPASRKTVALSGGGEQASQSGLWNRMDIKTGYTVKARYWKGVSQEEDYQV